MSNALIPFDHSFEPPADPLHAAFPAVSLELLEALSAIYPNRLPDLHVHERELYASIGRQQVIAFLTEMHNRPRS